MASRIILAALAGLVIGVVLDPDSGLGIVFAILGGILAWAFGAGSLRSASRAPRPRPSNTPQDGASDVFLPLLAFYLGPTALILGLQIRRAANRGAPMKGMTVAGATPGAIAVAWAVIASLITGGAIPRQGAV